MLRIDRGRPDPSAVRVALWRALHVEADPRPHVLDDALAGFRAVTHVSARALAERYFADRSDGLPRSSGEEILLAAP